MTNDNDKKYICPIINDICILERNDITADKPNIFCVFADDDEYLQSGFDSVKKGTSVPVNYCLILRRYREDKKSEPHRHLY
jgi:hypothetical protein